MLTWSRRWLARIGSRLAVGVVLVVVPVLLAIDQLSVSAPAQQEPSSLAVIPLPAPTRHAGMALGMLAAVEDCGSKVDVTVVAQPTAEYWIARRNAEEVTFALPDARHDDVRFRLGESASDVTTPQDVVDRGRGDGETRSAGIRVRKTRYEGPERDLLVATLEVPHWNRTLAPIIASYSADWLEYRGLGSCWLRLPARRATSRSSRRNGHSTPTSHSVRACRQTREICACSPGGRTRRRSIRRVSRRSTARSPWFRRRPRSANRSPTHRAARTAARRGSARPSPRRRHGRCTHPPLDQAVGHQRDGRRRIAGAFSSKVISSAKAGNCSAVAAVIESSAGWQRDLFMLVVGTVVGLGFTLLVDLLKGPRGARTSEDGA